MFYLQSEIEHDLNFNGVQIKVYPRRLEKDENYNFDIGLVKLDRSVVFSSDMAPICLTGFLPEYGPTSNAVYISGFGLTLYKRLKKTKKPECSTNEFLPRPYHTCKVQLKFQFWTL